MTGPVGGVHSLAPSVRGVLPRVHMALVPAPMRPSARVQSVLGIGSPRPSAPPEGHVRRLCHHAQAAKEGKDSVSGSFCGDGSSSIRGSIGRNTVLGRICGVELSHLSRAYFALCAYFGFTTGAFIRFLVSFIGKCITFTKLFSSGIRRRRHGGQLSRSRSAGWLCRILRSRIRGQML